MNIIPKIPDKPTASIPSVDTSQFASSPKLTVSCPPTDNILSARFAFVSNFPTHIECKKKEPFSGPRAGQFNRALAVVRMPKYEVYLTHAVKADWMKEASIFTEKGFKCPEWGILQHNLIKELSAFSGKVIVLLGELPMRLLLDDPRIKSIHKYRGSFFPAERFQHLAKPLKGKIILCSYHPDYSGRGKNKDPKAFYTLVSDFTRMKNVDANPDLLISNVDIKIDPRFDEVIKFYKLIETKDIVAFDIEAPPDFITCFSLAIRHENRVQSMCIPLMDNHGNYWSPQQELEVWQGLARILGSPSIRKIMQNGMFDITYMLRQMKIVTDNFYFDTMLAQHLCYTDLPKGLDYLTSVYTYEPYYKDQGKKVHFELQKDWRSYWKYNAKDSGYLFQIMDELQKELEDFEATESMRYQMELHKPLLEMFHNGILADVEGIAAYRTQLEAELLQHQKELNELIGKELNTNSSSQMIAYFYGTCMIKPYINRKTGNPSCDAVALSRIAKKGKKGSEAARVIMLMRTKGKLLSTYFRVNLDKDNKLRCTYNIPGTVSGRLSSEATYFGTGANLQNQPYIFKKFLQADSGYFFCEYDLAKAEAHVVAYLTQDEAMIKTFESGIDVHSFNASKIFDVSIEEVIHEAKTKKIDQKETKRYMGKKVVHASNYNMGPQTFSDNLAKENLFMQTSKCKRLLNAYRDRFPSLEKWQKRIDVEVSENKILYDLFGKPKRFLGLIGPALFRNAYSFIPQSTVARLLNNGMIKMSNDYRLGRLRYNIDMLVTVHDSVGIQTPIIQKPNFLKISQIIDDHMSYTFTHLGRSFKIGLDAKIGLVWAGKTAEISSFTQDNINEAFDKIGI
jgi:uracil-DNA glycosylase family 4